VVEGVRILLGLDIDAPHGRVSTAAPVGRALRGHRVEGLVINGQPASVEVSLDGELRWDGLGLDVVTGPQGRSSAGR
jgi:hypothetical protein